MAVHKLKKKQVHVILAISFGNILEWYDVYSYAYLAPVLAKLFFNFHSTLSNLIGAFLIFATGFITRPIGALIFGRIGDLVGRKNAFVWSIIALTIPTFLMGCLPTYASWGIFAPLSLVFLRLVQSIPESGESPGAFCFLYENADSNNKKFMTSWGAFGNQIGAIIGVFEALVLDKFMTEEFVMTWGWRMSFWTGGLLGLLGICLRSTLDETPVFKKIKAHHELDKETVRGVISNHKKKIILGTAYGAINASTFYLIATYIPTYFDQALGLSAYGNAAVSLSILVLTTVLLPFFGILGDKFKNKPILISCVLLIILLLYPLYFSINSKNLTLLAIVGFIYIIPITCITAFLPYLLAHLFATPVRFTGVSLTFNLADGIIGGFTPAIALFLLEFTKNQAAFCWFILACAIVSLFSYFKIKE